MPVGLAHVLHDLVDADGHLDFVADLLPNTRVSLLRSRLGLFEFLEPGSVSRGQFGLAELRAGVGQIEDHD